MPENCGEVLIRKLESIGQLSRKGQEALRRLELGRSSVAAHQDIVREGERQSSVTLVLSGFCCRYRLISDGKRQITSFHIPGDVPDLASLFVSVADYSLCGLVPSQLATISHAAMLALFDEQPDVARLFWRATIIDAAIFREWMVGLGRRSAFTRISHLFCELMVRMQAVGLSSDSSVQLPLTQADIADAMGLSTVHVNRTLQEIRGAGLVKFCRRKLVIRDWKALCDVAEFDPCYLHRLPSKAS